MKSKILALSKNEEFKHLLKQKKITNKYVSIFLTASFMMFFNLLLILFLFTALPIFFLVTKLIFSLFLIRVFVYLLMIYLESDKCLFKYLFDSSLSIKLIF